ncbi:hypothetical protein [Rhodococcus sp. HNM0569]|uniref:hypothetical protein n=1 Tax=Rhodococcus sp. HNM0569 TaxID=2716340 RepID=UPI001469D324|nr:hypothetical protein [Rhodococcus sp. HNM0569]NLU83492.1 hypothetical protein [Rhodococcus sp. HNM0569]
MSTRQRLRNSSLVAVAAAGLVCAGCAYDISSGAKPEPTTAPTSPPAPVGQPVVQVGDSALGPVETDSQGFTLYAQLEDEAAPAPPGDCNDVCRRSWVPVTSATEDPATAGLTGAAVDTVRLDDGGYQVVVNGMALYRNRLDDAAGETNGQGAEEHWWALDPSGTPILTTLDE